ncbi:MAG: sigma-E factor negative regulatory protein [Burkholderiaceae bacterium]
MVTDTEQRAAARERLSALMDGELGGDHVALACANWRAEPGSESSWHEYHLIGDVLRSEDLACDPAHDLAFLQAFRARLAGEPVVLAPQALESADAVDQPLPERARIGAGGGRRWSWMLPSVAAAGFVAFAGVLMLKGPADGGAADASMAQVAPSETRGTVPVALLEAESLGPQPFVASGTLIRDVRLDRYLDAHKQFSGSSALGVPSGFLRSATSAPSDR